ncbi:MAG: hypothetical protein ACFFED_03890 [Candidatus Thorarchaeota archaeon]
MVILGPITMSIPAKITFSQIGIFVSIISYLAVRGFFVVLNIGLLWTQAGGFLSIAFPIIPVIVLGFTACVVSYGYSYLGLWLMDNDQYFLGVFFVLLGVILVPGGIGVYSWFAFPLL